MEALSYFTYKVTMPLLNCVEKCDQNGLTQILPVLYRGQNNGRSMDITSQISLNVHQELTILKSAVVTFFSWTTERVCLRYLERVTKSERDKDNHLYSFFDIPTPALSSLPTPPITCLLNYTESSV